ncbi:MAG: hypothetical protein JNK15_13560 [Planctomycetes bacterium]|nr:hypothetical protein [Planctomycetota bacterium]
MKTASATQPMLQPPSATEARRSVDRDRDDRPVRAAAAARVSEDPMRRTDRYRLVRPWSDRF